MTGPTHPLVPDVPPLRVGRRSDGGGDFWIDPDHAQQAINQLRTVALDVLDLRDKHIGLQVQPPSADQVSRNVAAQANRMADNARAFIDAWARQLGDAALRLEEQLHAYRAAEEQNRRRMA